MSAGAGPNLEQVEVILDVLSLSRSFFGRINGPSGGFQRWLDDDHVQFFDPVALFGDDDHFSWAIETHALAKGFDELVDDVVFGGNGDLDAFTFLSVNHGEGSASFGVEIGGYVLSQGPTSRAEMPILLVSLVRVIAVIAFGGMLGEIAHDRQLIVPGLAEGGDLLGEPNIADSGASGHFSGWGRW